MRLREVKSLPIAARFCFVISFGKWVARSTADSAERLEGKAAEWGALPPPFLFVPLAVHYSTSFHRMREALDEPQGSPSNTQHALWCQRLAAVRMRALLCAYVSVA